MKSIIKGPITSLKTLGLALLSTWMLAGGLMFSLPTQAQNPQQGSIDVDATVPLEAAVITQPKNGQRFSRARITVKGTCGAATTVEIYKNDIFAGSTICNSGNFSLEIDLVAGRNILIAKVRAADGTYGPDSQPVTVFFDAPAKIKPPSAAPAPTQPTQPGEAVNQLIVTTNTLYKGAEVGDALLITINISGGQAPYEVVINWGDGSQEVVSRTSSGQFHIVHTYEQAGSYQISITATDTSGQEAYVQTVAVIDPAPPIGILERISHGLTWLDFLVMYLILLLTSLLLSIYSYKRGYYRGVQAARDQMYKSQQSEKINQSNS